MAFPFLSETGFETGTRDHFDAESDTDVKLDFPHYSTLCAIPGMPAPWRGAYCMRVDLSVAQANDAYVQETGSWDTAADGEIHFRFMFWFGAPTGESVTMANDDLFSIFELWSLTNTVEAAVFVQFTTASGYRLGVNETSAAAGAAFLPLTLNSWHAVELAAVIDAGTGNDGTLTLRLDGGVATAITTLDQGAITSGVLGVLDQDAGSTRGICLYDDIIADDARVFPPNSRWDDDIIMSASGHVFVGPGEILNITLISGAATDNVMELYDTDVGNTDDMSSIKCRLSNTANNEIVDPAGMPVTIHRGAYIRLSGTGPRALVQICRAAAWGSDATILTFAAKRKPAPRNV